MTTLTEVTMRTALPDEVPQICDTLSQAFLEDPVMRWALPDAARRHRVLPHFFELIATPIVAYGESLVAGDGAGAALWIPPGEQPVPVEQADEFSRRLEALAGIDAPRMFEIGALLGEHHPHGSFHYLQFVGVQPGWQGHGIGSGLIAPVLRRCDRDGLPAYLEATSLRSRKLYERHGFTATGELAVLGGPPLWPMWREPAAGPRRGERS